MSLQPDERAGLETALGQAIAYRDSISSRPIPPRIDLDEAMTRFHQPLNEAGEPIAKVINGLVQNADDGLIQMCSPNFHGFVLGASHPAGVAGDILVSAWGQNSPHNVLTPSIAAIEQTVASWVIELLDLPKESRAAFVTGATLANSAAVAAARNELLGREGWDVEASGLFGAPEIQVIVGGEAHSGVFAALRYNGLGAERVHKVPTNSDGVMDVAAFETKIAELSGPILVILQAGHINSGAFDPFGQIIPTAHRKNAWVHVDGAFGLWLRCAPDLARRLESVERADSWAVDLHKWLNAPFDAGMVITRHASALSRAMSARGSYLPETGGNYDPCDLVYELSRRARGVPSYTILRTLGKSGVREMISRHCQLAQHVAGRLAAEPGITVLNEIHANQIAVRFGQGPAADELTRETLKQIHQRGIVYPSHGIWRGGQILRVSIIGHETQLRHANKVADEIISAWRSVRKPEMQQRMFGFCL